VTRRQLLPIVALCAAAAATAFAAPPASPETKPAKPPSPEEQSQSEAVAKLGAEIDKLRQSLQDKPQLLKLLPDVQIFYDAARYPLIYHEKNDAGKAKSLLQTGMERAALLAKGEAPWVVKGGPRGYLSKVDNSVQPYNFSVPKGYAPNDGKKYRVDFYCHVRDESLTELGFIGGTDQHPDRFQVNVYGRGCNASKFVAEMEPIEILDSLKSQYSIDEDRVVLTGFSMGGGSVWHLSVHYTDLFCATSPGAGFAETREFQHINDKDLAKIPWYEQKLWAVYDCPGYVVNLKQTPVISYAGELDGQKQAGDIMAAAYEKEGMKFERIWGPHFGHGYESTSKKALDQRLDELAAIGRNTAPTKISFATYTLRYNHMDWVQVDALGKHWTQARVDAESTDNTVTVKTTNVTALTLNFTNAMAAFPKGKDITFVIDGQSIAWPGAAAGSPHALSFTQTDGKWTLGAAATDTLIKRHGLQGPVDDAFLDRFIMVQPTGTPNNEAIGTWCDAEFPRALLDWHKDFRGEAPVKKDTEITDADIASSNLILWGDPGSNAILAKIADKLPIRWTRDKITVGKTDYPSDHNLPVLIYPNPLNPRHYIVLNSGITFREGVSISNALQNPKLPDYAIVDTTTPANNHTPGKIADAGFFDEQWKLQENGGR